MFTALLIAILIVTGAATLVGGGLVLAAARRRELDGGDEPKQLTDGSDSDDSSDGEERTLDRVRVGDIVQHGGDDYLVEGVIQYDEDGHRWRGAKLTDGEDSRWLFVGMERMGSPTKRLLDIDETVELSGFPPEVMVVGKERYKLDKRGTATTTLSGEVGSLPGYKDLDPSSVMRCRWWRYEGTGDHTLVVEQWSGEYRVLRGLRMSNLDFEMMPGS